MTKIFNKKQPETSNIVLNWTILSLKMKSVLYETKLELFQTFLTSNAECWKSYLINVIYQTLIKVLSYENVSVNKLKVLFMAASGIAAVKIDDTKIQWY